MRGNRVFVTLAFAAVLGLAASYLVWKFILDRPVIVQASEKPSEEVKAVAAAVDLPVGELLTDEKLKVITVRGGDLPPGYHADKTRIVGRGVIVPMVANEMVLESKLAPEGAGAGLTTVIPEGMRGVSVKVDEVIGVAGFVLPSTRVDVLVTVDPGDEAQVSITKLVLQNVQVLAAGESIQNDAEGKPQKVTVITLLVNPEDAEKLTLASTEGRIQLALRNVLDQDSVSTVGSDIQSLVTSARRPTAAPPARVVRPVRAVAPPRPSTTVELYRGVEKEVESFSGRGGAPAGGKPSAPAPESKPAAAPGSD